MTAVRGGARPGAGRPKGEETTMVRVPQGCLEAVRALISEYRIHGYLPAAQPVVVQLDDRSTQAELLLPEPVADMGPLQRKAHEAWAVFNDVIMSSPFGESLRQRYMNLAADADELGYSYLFCLQLLERLLAMVKGDDHCPIQWANIRELRQFAKHLYRDNPAWH